MGGLEASGWVGGRHLRCGLWLGFCGHPSGVSNGHTDTWACCTYCTCNAGIAVAAKALKPGIKIIAAEPTGVNDAADVAACKAAGDLIPCSRPSTIADGLQGTPSNLPAKTKLM